MLNLESQNHRLLREVVYEELKKQILAGSITPGMRMMEVELAEDMGVSRTPVREAIRKLEKEGLVTIEPRKGAYASDISVKDMVDVLEVREELEGLSASLAASRITEEELARLKSLTEGYAAAIKENDMENMIHYDELFHKAIVKSSGNKTLIQFSESVQELALRFRYLYYDKFSLYGSMASEHMNIIEAIASGDEVRARQTADSHVRKLKDFIITEGLSAFK